ncbi:MAG: uroporphyrinogen decarboxylase family protein [Nitrososphaerales archaeon]
MNSFRRFEEVLMLREPDTVPIYLLGLPPPLGEKLLNRKTVWRNPALYLELFEKGKGREANRRVAEDIIDTYKKLDLDAIRVSCIIGQWLTEPNYEFLPNSAKVKKINEKLYKVNGIIAQYSPEIYGLLVRKPLIPFEKDEAKSYLKEHMNEIYVPEECVEPIRMIAKEYKGKKFILGIGWGSFYNVYHPFDRYMLWLREDIGLFKLGIEFMLRRAKEFIKAEIDAGADGIQDHDDYAYGSGGSGSVFLNPLQFKEYVLPALKELVNTAHKKGAYFIKHTDGNATRILNYIVEANVDGIQGLEKPAGMDISYVKENFGDKVMLAGNVDQSKMPKASIQEMYEEVKECISKASYGGGHALVTTNTPGPDAKLENILAHIEAGRKYGKYPLIISK